MRYLKLLRLVSINIIILIFCSANVHAQIFNWTTLDSNIAKLNGYWYCDSTAQYQEAYPHLTCMPPLSTDMPYDILLSYIYTDSLMRHLSRDDYYDKLYYWGNNNIKNDTTINFVKYFYLMQDYNPIILYQYRNDQSPDYYNFNTSCLYEAYQKLIRVAYNKQYFKALCCFLRPDYVLKVKVNSIVSSHCKQASVNPNLMLYYVNATVLDTLKGKTFKNCNQTYYNLIKKNDANATLSDLPQICFVYATGPYSNENSTKIDTLLLNSYGNLTLQPDQELIVTLELGSPLFDYNYDYFDIALTDVMPIVNGQVKDINYIWSDSILLDYDAWKTIFVQYKQMLLNGGY